jgi:glycosyltransferase 2 family protein
LKKHAAQWVKGLAKYGIGFGLLALVIAKYWKPNPQNGAPGLQQLLQGPIDFGWLALAAVLIAVALAMQLVRWYYLVRALDLPFTLRNAFRLGMVGVFANTFLPGAVGGDILKAIFLAKEHPERKTRAVATVLMDRALGLFGLILFTAVLGSVAWAGGDPRIVANVELQWLIKVMAAIAAGSVAGFLLLGLLPQWRVDRFAGRLKSVPKVGTSLSEFWYAAWIYRQRPRTVVLGVGLSALSHFGLVFAFHAASHVFPPTNPAVDQATLAEHMVIAPMGFIVQALPLSPGGVGVGEAAFAGLYKLSGRPESRGVIARLALRVVEWIIALVGYLVYLRMKAHHELPVVEDENGNGKEPPGTAPPGSS